MGKVLGCLVSTKGIEANPDKIKAPIDARSCFNERCTKVDRESGHP
jgi:hypothetical protein